MHGCVPKALGRMTASTSSVVLFTQEIFQAQFTLGKYRIFFGVTAFWESHRFHFHSSSQKGWIDNPVRLVFFVSREEKQLRRNDKGNTKFSYGFMRFCRCTGDAHFHIRLADFIHAISLTNFLAFFFVPETCVSKALGGSSQRLDWEVNGAL